MITTPDFDGFARIYDSGEAGRAQVVWTTLVADLETPVSAMLKLADGRPNSFLLESVEGGDLRGRYSIIGMNPDLIWRCRGEVAEIHRRGDGATAAFEPCPGDALDSLRLVVEESRIELPDDLPPMAAGLVGYLGYDTVRLIERLPPVNPDPIGIPDGLFLRPTVMAIFDNVKDTVTVVTPARPAPGVTARAAYDAATGRLERVIADFERSVPHGGEPSERGSAPTESDSILRPSSK